MHFIDVGQGDCTFIAATGVTMLVDCGEDEVSDDVITYLTGLGVGRLDYLIATHPHSDHMGGMYRVIDTFDIGEVIVPHVPDEQIPAALFFERFLDSCESSGVTVTEAEAGRVIHIGSAEGEIVAPDGSFHEDVNDYSVSLFITHGSNTFLLTGDAGAESEAAMLKSGRLGKVTLYKAGHHGSAYSSTEELLREIEPQAAVISCGSDNPYGHPAKSTLRRLEKYTSQIYRTDLNGSIVVSSDGSKLTFSTERGA